MQDIAFRVQDQIVRGKLLLPDTLQEKNPAVIFLHGWMSDYEGYIPRAEALVSLGYVCLIYDMRGHGTSDGSINNVTASGSLDDAVAAYDYVASLPSVDAKQISMVGSSYGGYIAALFAHKRQLFSLVLRVPAIYRNETFTTPKVNEIDEGRKVYRQDAIVHNDNLALQSLSSYTGKLLLIESEKDTVIPHQILESYRRAVNPLATTTDIVMRGADHNLSKDEWRKEYIQILVDWFAHMKELE